MADGICPVFRHSAEYALEHDELDLYRESYKRNMECRSAIESALHENYHDNSLDAELNSVQVGQNFGWERLSYVLANTIIHKRHDGRISEANKAWAETIGVSEDISEWGDDRNVSFIVDRVNPVLIDLFANEVRKVLQEMAQKLSEQKPSILERIRKPIPDETASRNNADYGREAFPWVK